MKMQEILPKLKKQHKADEGKRPFNMPVIQRFWEMPRRYTFEMKVAKHILKKHGVGIGWVDPFAGYNSPAQYTNDLDPNAPTDEHIEAMEYLKRFNDCSVDGVLLDPPYSLHQVTISYGGRGTKRVNSLTPVYDEAMRICRIGGKLICWGWNSNGIGKRRKVKMTEIYLIAHGGHHNDTIVTIEIKMAHQGILF